MLLWRFWTIRGNDGSESVPVGGDAHIAPAAGCSDYRRPPANSDNSAKGRCGHRPLRCGIFRGVTGAAAPGASLCTREPFCLRRGICGDTGGSVAQVPGGALPCSGLSKKRKCVPVGGDAHIAPAAGCSGYGRPPANSDKSAKGRCGHRPLRCIFGGTDVGAGQWGYGTGAGAPKASPWGEAVNENPKGFLLTDEGCGTGWRIPVHWGETAAGQTPHPTSLRSASFPSRGRLGPSSAPSGHLPPRGKVFPPAGDFCSAFVGEGLDPPAG